MSAYIVGKDHIDLLVSATVEAGHNGLRWYPVDNLRGLDLDDVHYLRRDANAETADRIGAMLIGENIESVRFRYPDDTDEELPGPTVRHWKRPYTWEPVPAPLYTAADVVMAVDGYEYQACEHPRWPVSEARLFCDALRWHYAGKLASGSKAWEWTRPSVGTVIRVI